MTKKTPFGLYLLLAVAAIILLYSSGVSLTGIPGVLPQGSIIVKVVNSSGAAVEDAKVFMIPPDRGNPYDIMDKQTGYTELRISNSNGIADFGSSWDTSTSWSIGVRCTQAQNYSSNFKQYNPVVGTAIGYNLQITCPPNKRPTVAEMIAGNHTIPQEYVTEGQVKGVGPVCFMDTYIDESCSESNYGDKSYYFNADRMSPRGFKVKQCWTPAEWVYDACLPGEVGIGGYCVTQASYFTNMDCGSIKPGYTRMGNFCVAPMPSASTTTTIPGGVTTTTLGYTTTTTLGGGNVGGYDLNLYGLIGILAFIGFILIMYKRGKK